MPIDVGHADWIGSSQSHPIESDGTQPVTHRILDQTGLRGETTSLFPVSFDRFLSADCACSDHGSSHGQRIDCFHSKPVPQEELKHALMLSDASESGMRVVCRAAGCKAFSAS